MPGAASSYRLAQVGVHIMLPYVNKRQIQVPIEDLRTLLYSKPQQHLTFDEFSPSVRAAIAETTVGSIVLSFEQGYVVLYVRVCI